MTEIRTYPHGVPCWVDVVASDLLTSDPHAAAAFYAPLFGWEADDVGFATMVRRPGYGDHLEATVYPDIRAVQAGVSAPPGFEDAIAWIGVVSPGEPELWQVSDRYRA